MELAVKHLQLLKHYHAAAISLFLLATCVGLAYRDAQPLLPWALKFMIGVIPLRSVLIAGFGIARKNYLLVIPHGLMVGIFGWALYHF